MQLVQVRTRANPLLIVDPMKFLKTVSKLSYLEAQIMSDDSVMVRLNSAPECLP